MTKVNLDLLAAMMIELGKGPLRRKGFQAVMQYKFEMPVSMFNTCLGFLREKYWVGKEEGRTGAYRLTDRGFAFLEGWHRSRK